MTISVGGISYPSVDAYARQLRRITLEMAFSAGAASSHIGGALSIIDITAVLFGQIVRFDPNDPVWPDRDRYVLSKGHACLAYYAALHSIGYIDAKDISNFGQADSRLLGHPVMDRSIGIEFSNGSLGMGLSLGIGVALAGKKSGRQFRVFVVMGDGECNEGSVWEAAMAASHFQLDNLFVVIDRNQLQQTGTSSDIMDLRDLTGKWREFGWDAEEINGHNLQSIHTTFTKNRSSSRPVAVIANTTKGKGISFIENDNAWHHGVLTKKMFSAAMTEIGK